MTDARLVRRISGSVNAGRDRKSCSGTDGCTPLRYAAAAPFTLVGGSLRHRFDRQALHLGAEAVAADARGARIDDVLDARHRQRGFRHVGGQHDAAAVVRLEYPVLLAVRQARIQRQHLGMRQIEAVQGVGGIADLALAAHEDQNVARPFAPKLVHRIENRLQLVAIGIVAVVDHRAVAYLHRVGAAGNLDDRCIVEMAREALRIDGRRGDDHLQIRALRQQFAQVAENKVDIEAALVRFIDDQRVVLHQ